MDKLSKLVFFEIEKNIGGKEMLTANLITFFSKYTSFKILLVARPDSVVLKILRDRKIKNIEVVDYPITNKIWLGSDSFLITYPGLLPYLDEVFDRTSEGKVLVWMVTAHEFLHMTGIWRGLKGMGFIKDTIGGLLQFLLARNSLYFIDYSNFKFNYDSFHISNKDIRYLPVPIFISHERRHPKRISKNEINIVWLGRSGLGKYHSILKIIGDISKCSDKVNKKIRIHFITNTEGLAILKKRIEKITDNHKNIELIYNTELYEEELDKYILDNADIGFGMGTSTLHFAVLKKPVFIIDVSDERFPDDYLYRALYETKFFDLGYYVLGGVKNDDGLKMDEILALEGKELTKMGEKCYEYTTKNHDIKFIGKKILQTQKDNNLSLKELFSNNYFRKFESIYFWSYKLFAPFKPIAKSTVIYFNTLKISSSK